MEFAEVRVVLPTRATPWRLYPLGDLHVGAAAFDKEAFEAKVAEIAEDPHGYWLGMGDYADFIGFRDPRFDPKTIAPDIKANDLTDIWSWQAHAFLKMVEPIKGKCLGMLCGNHEESVRLHNHFDPGLSMAAHLGVPDLRYAAAITIKVYEGDGIGKKYKTDNKTYLRSRYTVRVYGHHGWGGGRTESGKVMKVTRDMLDIAPIDTQIFMMGHVHLETAIPKGRMRFSGRNFAKPSVYGTLHVITGTYLRNWISGGTTYSEKMGMGMVHIGSPTVEIKLTTKRPDRKIDGVSPNHNETIGYRILGSWVSSESEGEG